MNAFIDVIIATEMQPGRGAVQTIGIDGGSGVVANAARWFCETQ
jgi:hypothetical protein